MKRFICLRRQIKVYHGNVTINLIIWPDGQIPRSPLRGTLNVPLYRGDFYLSAYRGDFLLSAKLLFVCADKKNVSYRPCHGICTDCTGTYFARPMWNAASGQGVISSGGACGERDPIWGIKMFHVKRHSQCLGRSCSLFCEFNKNVGKRAKRILKRHMRRRPL